MAASTIISQEQQQPHFDLLKSDRRRKSAGKTRPQFPSLLLLQQRRKPKISQCAKVSSGGRWQGQACSFVLLLLPFVSADAGSRWPNLSPICGTIRQPGKMSKVSQNNWNLGQDTCTILPQHVGKLDNLESCPWLLEKIEMLGQHAVVPSFTNMWELRTAWQLSKLTPK